MKKNYYVAIMAGGIGSRFWPVSRTGCPKQFLDILGTGKTLIQNTFERFAQFIPKENIYVITADEYVPLVKEQLPGMKDDQILSEPSRKNTAPCIAYISYKLAALNPDSCLLCAPADHLIMDTTDFVKTSLEAFEFVAKHKALKLIGFKEQ